MVKHKIYRQKESGKWGRKEEIGNQTRDSVVFGSHSNPTWDWHEQSHEFTRGRGKEVIVQGDIIVSTHTHTHTHIRSGPSDSHSSSRHGSVIDHWTVNQSDISPSSLSFTRSTTELCMYVVNQFSPSEFCIRAVAVWRPSNPVYTSPLRSSTSSRSLSRPLQATSSPSWSLRARILRHILSPAPRYGVRVGTEKACMRKWPLTPLMHLILSFSALENTTFLHHLLPSFPFFFFICLSLERCSRLAVASSYSFLHELQIPRNPGHVDCGRNPGERTEPMYKSQNQIDLARTTGRTIPAFRRGWLCMLMGFLFASWEDAESGLLQFQSSSSSSITNFATTNS